MRLFKRNRAGYLASGTLIAACLCALPASGTAQQNAEVPAAKKPATAKPPSKTKKAATHKAHPATSVTASKSTAKSTNYAHSSKHSSHKKPVKVRGQQKIDSERARSIQEALIREHYLSGDPSGTWNEQSEEAMRRYQSDHGWQTKEVPDSRALIKLGLGPSHDHLLNPESAMTTPPDAPRSNTAMPVSNSAAPASVPTPSQTNSSDPQ
ncbi:MAG TPA: peptidoglycan-binding domain-containing protein [Candidatus Sulfotelmatobacter sp.]|nr:peptidoglycan-binding domain-containing protein [Candidatus Sulfotelmatobacter sp.]